MQAMTTLLAALLAAAAFGADVNADSDPNACGGTTPSPVARARVRRSISNLTDTEWDRVTNAMWVMRTTDTLTGQAMYGNQYNDWDYFVLRHVISSVCINEDDLWRDPDLDTTGHDLFAIWHGVQLVEFENALVSVDPLIDGLPYLDYKETANDLVNYDDPTTTFSRRLGSTLAQSPVAGNLGVPTDGPFAWWPVPAYASIADAFSRQPGLAAAYGGDGSELAAQIETRIFNDAFGQPRSCTYEDNDVLTERAPYLLRAVGDRKFPLTGKSYELLEIACAQVRVGARCALARRCDAASSHARRTRCALSVGARRRHRCPLPNYHAPPPRSSPGTELHAAACPPLRWISSHGTKLHAAACPSRPAMVAAACASMPCPRDVVSTCGLWSRTRTFTGGGRTTSISRQCRSALRACCPRAGTPTPTTST